MRWGRFFLERYNENDAGKLFKEALELDEKNADALLGAALVGASSFDAKAAEFADKALASNPKLVEAQELKAILALEDANTAKAIEEAESASPAVPASAVQSAGKAASAAASAAAARREPC